MATRKKNLDVTNRRSIQSMIKYFEDYEKDLPRRCQEFCSKLADVGIQVATISTLGNGLGNYVVFAKEIKSVDKNGCSMIMYGKDIREITGDGVDAADISPILMLEYGSGSKGVPFRLVDGLAVGQGTFPGQKHAFDPKGWYYKSTKDGEWHHSYGVTPSYPMQKAYDTMQKKVDTIAREVFKLP